jgi:hypothetical protein
MTSQPGLHVRDTLLLDAYGRPKTMVVPANTTKHGEDLDEFGDDDLFAIDMLDVVVKHDTHAQDLVKNENKRACINACQANATESPGTSLEVNRTHEVIATTNGDFDEFCDDDLDDADFAAVEASATQKLGSGTTSQHSVRIFL